MSLSAISSGLPGGFAERASSAKRAADPFAAFLQAAGATQSQPAEGLESLRRAASAGGAQDRELEALRRSADNGLSELQRTLRQLFAERDIDTSQEIRLESDGQGGVTVGSPHSDSADIEQIFKDNPDLAAKFQALAAAYTRLQAAEAGPAAGEPLFRPAFGVSFTDDQARVAFK